MKERRSYPESIVKLLDHFEHAGPNGLYLCLVLELMWGDMGNMMGGLGSYDLPEIRKIVNKEVSRQVLKGLEVLAEMGITHNGRKLFLKFAELLAVEQSRESYDPNQDIFYEDPNGKAVIYYSRPLNLVADGETIDIKKMQVKIADFGKATFLEERDREYGDRTMLAPEVLLGSTWDCMADVWSLGVPILNCLGGGQLFHLPYSSNVGRDLVSKMIPICGDLPDDLYEKWKELFPNDDDRPCPEPYTTPLQYYLAMGFEDISGAEIRVMTDFLASMMQMDPKDRVSPTELLKHRWLSEDKISSRNTPCVCGTGR